MLGLEAWQCHARRHGRPGRALRPAVLRHPRVPALPDLRRPHRAGPRGPRARSRATDVDLDARVAEIEHAMQQRAQVHLQGPARRRLRLLPIVWIGIGLSVFQQFVGINVAFYYSSTLWQSVGVDPTELVLLLLHDVDHQHHRHRDRDDLRRPDRPQAARPHRLGRHGRLASALEAWAFSVRPGRRQAARHPGLGRPDRRPRLRPLLRPVLGRGGLGPARRDVPEPDPRRRPRRRRLRPVDRQLGHHRELPVAWRTGTCPATYVIYTVFAALSIPFILKWVKETKGKALEEMG